MKRLTRFSVQFSLTIRNSLMSSFLLDCLSLVSRLTKNEKVQYVYQP